MKTLKKAFIGVIIIAALGTAIAFKLLHNGITIYYYDNGQNCVEGLVEYVCDYLGATDCVVPINDHPFTKQIFSERWDHPTAPGRFICMMPYKQNP